jgi:hypothetical protein
MVEPTINAKFRQLQTALRYRQENEMSATTENKRTLEDARRAVIDSLTRSELKTGAGPEFKELDETNARQPAFRPVRMMFYI